MTPEEIRFVPVESQGILQEHDPRLREVSIPVEVWGPGLQRLAARLIDAMQRANGIGISAIQIGVPLRLIVVTISGEPIAMVNPHIVRTLRREVVEVEGCLSVDRRRWLPVSRPAKCDVEWTGLDGIEHSATLSNLEARCVLHEVEHLDGILMTERQA